VAQCASIDFRPAAITFFHFDEALLGIVICGSLKYIGSSGGNLKLRFGS
jgi:hypothetical protein